MIRVAPITRLKGAPYEQITTTPSKSIGNPAIWTLWLHLLPQRKRTPAPEPTATTLPAAHPFTTPFGWYQAIAARALASGLLMSREELHDGKKVTITLPLQPRLDT